MITITISIPFICNKSWHPHASPINRNKAKPPSLLVQWPENFKYSIRLNYFTKMSIIALMILIIVPTIAMVLSSCMLFENSDEVDVNNNCY